MTNIREPAVAGSFYPSTGIGLISLLKSIYNSEKDKIRPFPDDSIVIGAIVPHAGYVYSGYEAMHFFSPLAQYKEAPDTILILNPDHNVYGNEVAVDSNEIWKTPMGNVDVDIDFCNLMNIEIDSKPHQYEHSAEVMLPFLQYFLKQRFKIVPISITHQLPDVAKKLANKIFEANKKLNRRLIIIASSDFSHFVSPSVGTEKDNLALNEIENLDPEKFYEVIRKNNISICGYGPIMTLMEYSKKVSDNTKATVLARGNSGKSGQRDKVVDYNTVLFHYK